MTDLRKISRVLISVSDKTGVVNFAQSLDAKGIEILSTGGTYRLIKDNGINVREVSDYTGFPEMMDGRVKTLHPRSEEHTSELQSRSDLVCRLLLEKKKSPSNDQTPTGANQG